MGRASRADILRMSREEIKSTGTARERRSGATISFLSDNDTSAPGLHPLWGTCISQKSPAFPLRLHLSTDRKSGDRAGTDMNMNRCVAVKLRKSSVPKWRTRDYGLKTMHFEGT
jgi:hypothetical protein